MDSVVHLNLTIAVEEMRRWYAGEAHVVEAKSVDGRLVRFPANILRPFVTRDGVQGLFEIRYDQQGKFHSIVRL